MSYTLPLIAGFIAIVSVLLSRRTQHYDTFFHGMSENGEPPGLWTLVFSQVTTWIFARSLMNAAILGFYYGLWGTLAYALYYLSFITGGLIIDSLRFRHGFSSVQDFLHDRFGRWGTGCYNFVVGIRLISEVFANLLVIGILFGAAGSQLYVGAILAFSAVTLLYSMLGGLHASIRTDVFQMLMFLLTLAVLLTMAVGTDLYSSESLLFKAFDISDPGPVLMLVALLQIWSYPLHDPVMMDRGFLADRATTRKSFLHAAWISGLSILTFGSLGIVAGASATQGEAMTVVLQRLLGDVPMLMFNAALVISA
ncbi:MAG TPA: sodium:proline symporter, partial [Gammaproteobacteria bacterium]